MNRVLPVDRDFLSYTARDDVPVSSLVLSGFNSIADPAVLTGRLGLLAAYAQRMRRKGAVVYLEDAAYHAPALKAQVLARLGPALDVFGFNEQELRATLALDGRMVDVKDPLGILAGLEQVLDRYRVLAVLLHTQAYAVFYGQLPERDIELGLLAGYCLAGARALHGRYGSWRDVERASRLPESREGLAAKERLQGSVGARPMRVVPARTIARPRCTLGLGDAFVGGFQACL